MKIVWSLLIVLLANVVLNIGGAFALLNPPNPSAYLETVQSKPEQLIPSTKRNHRKQKVKKNRIHKDIERKEDPLLQVQEDPLLQVQPVTDEIIDDADRSTSRFIYHHAYVENYAGKLYCNRYLTKLEYKDEDLKGRLCNFGPLPSASSSYSEMVLVDKSKSILRLKTGDSHTQFTLQPKVIHTFENDDERHFQVRALAKADCNDQGEIIVLKFEKVEKNTSSSVIPKHLKSVETLPLVEGDTNLTHFDFKDPALAEWADRRFEALRLKENFVNTRDRKYWAKV